MQDKKDKVRWAPPLLNEIPDVAVSALTPVQSEAYRLYCAGCYLYNKDISGSLTSEQAYRNVQAMKLWYRSAELGFIKAMEVITRSTEEGGFVKEPLNNYGVADWGQGMGLNLDGELGWNIMRRFGKMAVEAGADNLNSFGNSPKVRENIYTMLARAYGDDELLGTEPDMVDYSKCYDCYIRAAAGSFKSGRYIAELYWFGRIVPPEGKTRAQAALEAMLKSIDKDATACFLLGLWYLNDDGKGPVLPLNEGETKYTMAVKYLELGNSYADHGTIRKALEALMRLAQIYAIGEGDIPKCQDRALAIYNKMLSEHFYPGNADIIKAKSELLSGCSYPASSDTDGIPPAVTGNMEKTEFAGRTWLKLCENEDSMLIISEDIIEQHCYNSVFTQITWESCELRHYLNGEFLERLSPEDRNLIISKRISNPYNYKSLTYAGNETEDYIFLLSEDEINIFLPENAGANLTYWTRTPGSDQRFIVMVRPDGRLNQYGWRAQNPYGGVRPAMWIKKRRTK